MADFNTWPHSIATNVRGEETDDRGNRNAWIVDSEGILRVSHRDEDGDYTVQHYRLVPVEQVWQEVDGG